MSPLRWSQVPSLIRLLIQGVTLVLLLTSHAAPVRAAFTEPDGAYDEVVVEHLRLKVPAEARQAWISAEQGSWEPWLAQQKGFLDRQLLWDPATEEGTLLIRWPIGSTGRRFRPRRCRRCRSASNSWPAPPPARATATPSRWCSRVSC